MKAFLTIKKIIYFLFLFLFIFFDRNVLIYAQEVFTAQKYKEIGDSYRVQKNKLSAVEYYKKSLNKNKEFVPALISIGTLMREFGSYNESKKYLSQANKLDPSNRSVLLELIKTTLAMDNISEAESLLKTAFEISPQEPDFEYLQARIFIVKNQFYLAEHRLTQIVKNNPGHIDSFIALGDLYLREKRYKQAQEAYERVRLIDSENPQVYIGLFQIQFASTLAKEREEILKNNIDISAFREAIEYLLNAKEFDNDYIPANLILGKIYALANECDKAQSYLESVLKINPEHQIAQYYMGYCFPKKNLNMYKLLLSENQNNDILNYSYERNLIKYSERRENQQLLDMARIHYGYGMSLFKSHMTHHGVFEMNWARYLYPTFVPAHNELLQHYRSKKDFVKMAEELGFLRKVTGEVKYQDMYEMLVEGRKEKLYYREKIYRPEEYKTPTPVFVFHFTPENFLGDYPDAGEAISEKLTFAMEEIGRIQVLSGSQRDEVSLALNLNKKKIRGLYYNAENGKIVLNYMKKTMVNKTEGITDSHYVRYAITGKYKEVGEGLEVSTEIIDLETGISFAPFRVKSSGRGYIRDIVTKLAQHIHDNMPYHGRIIKISSNGVIINLGEREGVTKKSKIGVYRDKEKIADLQVDLLDMDVMWAKPKNHTDIYRIQTGDLIKVE
ncbi:MAG: tetratricopeptide repeat protein [Spirochaetia bacterium]|nr:tetratricopeptide repeat protein [Spirochaetia bacterium]